MPLFISKNNILKRKKGIAVATAQVLYHAGFTAEDINLTSDAISALKSINGKYYTAYGTVRPEELLSVIESEGLDIEEFKTRIRKYWRNANNRLEKMEKEKIEQIINDVSESLINMGIVKVKNFDDIIEEYGRAVNVLKIYDGKMNIEHIKMLKGNDQFIKNLNYKLAKKDYELKTKEELQKFIDGFYQKEKIGGTIDEVIKYKEQSIRVVAEIGTVFLDQEFKTIEKAKNAIKSIIRSEQKKVVKCTHCGKPYTLYSLISGDVAKCSCGAIVRVTGSKKPSEYGFDVRFMLNKPREPLSGYSKFIYEIGRHVYNDAILTYSFKSQAQSWDVRKVDKDLLFFGINALQNTLFPKRFIELLKKDGYAGVVLRTFTDKKDEITGYPIKELRGYFVSMVNHKLVYKQISAQEMAHSNNTDALTGKPLIAERGVIYCGPDDDYLDDNFNKIEWPNEK
jgi:hypothetical protein